MKSKLIWVVFLLIISGKIISQPGSPDKKFGESGIVVSPDRSNFTHILPLNSGKFILVDHETFIVPKGTFVNSVFLRYNANGTLDGEFGYKGMFRWASSDYNRQYFTSLILQPDGKILAVDNERNQIWRIDGNAKADPTFGTGGIASLSVLGYYLLHIKSITFDQQSRIIVSGFASEGKPGTKNRLFIARLNSNGIPDETFNRTGYKIVIETTDLDYSGVFCATDRANDIIVNVEAGIRQRGGFQSYISKYKSNGSLDLSFGQQGSVSVNSILFSLLTDQNSKIIFLTTGNIKRLNPNGSLDKIIFERPSGTAVSFSKLAVQPDNKIIAVGVMKPANDNKWNIYISRFAADGNPDKSFGNGGSVLSDLNFSASVGNIYYTNNRLFVSGHLSYDSKGYGLILAFDASNSYSKQKENIFPRNNKRIDRIN